MHRHKVDCTGLTLAEAEAKVRAMIDDYHANALEHLEMQLVGISGDLAYHAAIKRRRAELAENREQLIKKWRAMATAWCAENDSGRMQ